MAVIEVNGSNRNRAPANVARRKIVCIFVISILQSETFGIACHCKV